MSYADPPTVTVDVIKEAGRTSTCRLAKTNPSPGPFRLNQFVQSVVAGTTYAHAAITFGAVGGGNCASSVNVICRLPGVHVIT